VQIGCAVVEHHQQKLVDLGHDSTSPSFTSRDHLRGGRPLTPTAPRRPNHWTDTTTPFVSNVTVLFRKRLVQ
jgi:hypothetical protein